MIRKIVVIILLSVSSIYAEELLRWKNLEPTKYYSAEQVNQLVNDNYSALEKYSYQIQTRRFVIYFRKTDGQNYTVKKTDKSVKRLLVCSEPYPRQLGGTFEAYCVDSMNREVGDSVFYDDTALALCGIDDKGCSYLYYLGFLMDKSVVQKLDEVRIGEGAFGLNEFYFWDKTSKRVSLFKVDKRGQCKLISDENLHFENPMIFGIEEPDMPSLIGLYITEVDKNRKPVTGEYWFINGLKMIKQNDLLILK